MAKRFIDTGLFDDPWFMDLSLSAKVLWIYFITKCDHAGILEFNEKLCQFQTGIKSIGTVTEELANRLVRVKEQYIFIPKFIDFQYPGFPKSTVKQQESALNRLIDLGLYAYENKELTKTYLRLSEELPKSYDNVNNNNIVNNSSSKLNKGRKIYDEYIATAETDLYIKFANWLLSENFESIFKMDDQIDEKRFYELYNKSDKKNSVLKEKIHAMENKPDLLKKYKSFYRTLLNWI